MPKAFEGHTRLEINELLNEIPNVSTTFNLKEYVGRFTIKNYRLYQDFEEFASKEEQDASDFEMLKQECEKMGIKPPTSIRTE